MFAALLLVSNLISLRKNEFRVGEGAPNDDDEVGMGYGVYIWQNMMHNLCDPNAEVLYTNRYRCLYALRPIKKDEPVSIQEIFPSFVLRR